MELGLIYSHLAGYIQMLLQQATVLNISRDDWNVKKLFLSITTIYTLYVLLLQIDIIGHNSLIARIVWLVFLFLSYLLFYKIPANKSAVMAILQITANASVENVFVFILTFVPKWLQDYFMEHIYATRCVAIVVFLAIFLVSNNFKSKEDNNRDYRTNVLLFVYLVFIFLLIEPIIINIEKNNVGYVSNQVDLLNVSLIIILFAMNIAYMRKIRRTTAIEKQLEFQELYSKSLEKTTSELRGFKHDFSNIINTINGYVELSDLASLQVYMQELNLDIYSIKTKDIVNTELKRIPALYGLLLSKIYQAELLGIILEVSVQNDINSEYCSIVDFSRIVGILLDNAIESAADSEEKLVALELMRERDRQLIRVTNSCDTPVDIDKIFTSGYSTKEGHAGEGLHQIKALFDKYMKKGFRMEVESDYSGRRFTQVVKI